jgi:hypothetical protein
MWVRELNSSLVRVGNSQDQSSRMRVDALTRQRRQLAGMVREVTRGGVAVSF